MSCFHKLTCFTLQDLFVLACLASRQLHAKRQRVLDHNLVHLSLKF